LSRYFLRIVRAVLTHRQNFIDKAFTSRIIQSLMGRKKKYSWSLEEKGTGHRRETFVVGKKEKPCPITRSVLPLKRTDTSNELRGKSYISVRKGNPRGVGTGRGNSAKASPE